MTKPTGIGIGASVIALVALTAPLAGQAPARPAGTIAGATATPPLVIPKPPKPPRAGWVPPKTAWGDPDIQGNFTNKYEAIRYEMIHETRVIPLDNRPHVSRKLHLDMGDARGHWEGNTLVVETTNFRDRTAYRQASQDSAVANRV